MGASVRANWHLGDLELPSGDPEDITAMGKIIDLSGTEAELQAELKASLDREVRYSGLYGDECKLKWRGDHRLMGGSKLSCFTCPQYTQEEADPLSSICVLGREQENLQARIAALQENGSLDDELAERYVAEADAAAELAEAFLTAA